MENGTTEVVKETSVRRRWVLLCWVLTWWIPPPFLKRFGRMKRQDIRGRSSRSISSFGSSALVRFPSSQLLGLSFVRPSEHIFSTSELASHTYSNSPNNIYTAICGEAFDLTPVSATHTRVVTVIPSKTVLEYGGLDASNLFPVQVRLLFLCLQLFSTVMAGQHAL